MSQSASKAVFASADAALEAARAIRSPKGSPAEVEAAEAAARLAPDRADAWIAVAGAATRVNDAARAEFAQLRALELTTDPLTKDRLYVDRAWALSCQRRWAEALELARTPRPMLALDPISRNIIGATLMSVGMGAEAAPHLEFAASHLTDRPDVLFNLATVYRSLGRPDDAVKVLEKILQFAPGHLPVYELLSDLRKARPEDNQIARLRAVRPRFANESDRAHIDYALFKQLNDLGQYEEAWTVLARANHAEAAEVKWSLAREQATAGALRQLQASIPSAGGAQPASPRPIFIISLPRSGSTLIERVFAAHSRVRSLGELETFGRELKVAAGLDPNPYIDARVATAGPIDWSAVGKGYREEIAGLADGAEVITDKMPLNWWYAPAIAAALPDASILHIRREPMDALFGAFKLSFGAGFTWCYRQEDMAAHYGVYRRLVADWRKALGERFIEVDYEALVRDPATVTPQMLAACGLDFEEACLKPHLSVGSVSTPSAGQVREPITAANIGSWRRYATQLEPLRALLQADGWVDANGDGVAGE